jgi:hypothetical protein
VESHVGRITLTLLNTPGSLGTLSNPCQERHKSTLSDRPTGHRFCSDVDGHQVKISTPPNIIAGFEPRGDHTVERARGDRGEPSQTAESAALMCAKPRKAYILAMFSRSIADVGAAFARGHVPSAVWSSTYYLFHSIARIREPPLYAAGSPAARPSRSPRHRMHSCCRSCWPDRRGSLVGAALARRWQSWTFPFIWIWIYEFGIAILDARRPPAAEASLRATVPRITGLRCAWMSAICSIPRADVWPKFVAASHGHRRLVLFYRRQAGHRHLRPAGRAE